MKRILLPAVIAAALLAGCTPFSRFSEPVQFAPSVDAEKALEHVQYMVDLGPRHSGSEAIVQTSNYLVEQMQAAGLEARLIPFEDDSPIGKTTFYNVEAVIPGNTDGIVIFGSHHDTKNLGDNFVGANDAGSSSGLLIELARSLKQQADTLKGPRPELRFVFFDGEECMVNYGHNDGFHGSRHYAQDLVDTGLDTQVLAVIVLDMIGDKDLTVTLPPNGTPFLLAAALKAAGEEGVREKFKLRRFPIRDDHEAFFERNMPAVDIIDFEFGSAPGKNDYWHTDQDTMDKISAESLGIAGRVAIRVMNQVIDKQM